MDADLLAWAEGLVSARLMGGWVADPPRPIDLEAGYALADRLAPGLGRAIGWKVGATSAGAMAALGVTEPIRGRLFAERLWPGAGEAVPALAGAQVEPEVAFRLARPLAPGGDPLAAVGDAFAAAEIVRPSHPRAFGLGAGFIVADNAASLGAVPGPALPLAALAEPGTLGVRLESGGAATEGTADMVLGDPLRSLAWLAGVLGGLPAGVLVLTGAMAPAIALAPGPLVIDAGMLGRTQILVMG
jgi:2-oxo-3-hexenedioate decarboxylase/2-keto-4-pentenoate hydratase